MDTRESGLAVFLCFAFFRPSVMRLSSLLLSSAPIAALLLAACAAVTADGDFSGESTRARGGGDDPVQTIDDDGGKPSSAPDAGSSTRAGSPLCGDRRVCSPDDPRLEPVCGNELAPVSDAGMPMYGGGDDDADGEAPSDDAGSVARPLACRVQTDGSNSCENRAGNGGEGVACKLGTDCGAGLDCVRELGTEGGTCRAYCCDGLCSGVRTGNAGEGRFCDPTVRLDDGNRIPACLPIHSCRLLGEEQCLADQTCAVVREIDGSTGCVETGKAEVGDSCDVEHCAAGLNCLGTIGMRTCFQLCSDSGAACPSGQACTWAPPAFREAGLGVCTASVAQRLF